MAFDGITTFHLIAELNATLVGGRIRKIYQPEADEIRLLINCGRDNYNLLLSANANNPRVYVTEKLKENPNTPPNFCMVLRKHLTNGTIDSIVQHETDRVVEIAISGKNEFNDMVVKKLIVEIMGRNSNIILIDDKTDDAGVYHPDAEDIILDALKKVGSGMNRYRQILPGKPYIYPPESDRLNFLTVTPEGFDAAVKAQPESVIERFFVQKFLGLSPVVAREICFRAGIPADSRLKELTQKQQGFLYQGFDEIRAALLDHAEPAIYTFNRDIVDFATIDLHHLTDCKRDVLPSVSAMLENFYYLKDKKIRFSARAANLKHQLDTLLKKSYKKLDNLHQDMEASRKSEKNKYYGDLITANIYLLQKGMKSAELTDYTDPDMPVVTVPLKVNETPAQNAQRFYKKYNKGKRAQVLLQEQIATTEEQIYYLESLMNSLEQSTELEELSEIRHEFAHSEFSKRGPAKDDRKKLKPSKPMHYVSSEGFDIYVGKNNYQNDYISTRLGTEEDCWLHVKDIPGSHVLVVADGRFITEATLLEAGMLAAYYSKAKNSENVPVDYVEFKYLKKPKHAKPGMVIFTNQNTMYVTPDRDKISALEQLEA